MTHHSFQLFKDKNDSASQLDNDFDKVSDWASTWKMSFSPDLSKRAQEVIFSRKCTKEDHLPIYFNNLYTNHPDYRSKPYSAVS